MNNSSPDTAASHIAVCGALAYDQICRTSDPIIVNEQPLLNAKLHKITESFGGCAGNILYNLARLNNRGVLVTCTGAQDDAPYLKQLRQLQLDLSHCLRLPGLNTARAIIFTDPNELQFTGFYPGPIPESADWQSHLQRVNFTDIQLFLQAPYPSHIMTQTLSYVRGLTETPLRVFAPGQYADQLTPAEAAQLIGLSDWVIGNAYEVEKLLSHHPLMDKVVVTTHGAEPIEVQCRDLSVKTIAVPAVTDSVDPTGCGDAFIAGVCHALLQRCEFNSERLRRVGDCVDNNTFSILQDAILLGCALAADCLAQQGPQHHPISLFGAPQFSNG